jgi:hypothetical protein
MTAVGGLESSRRAGSAIPADVDSGLCHCATLKNRIQEVRFAFFWMPGDLLMPAFQRERQRGKEASFPVAGSTALNEGG